MALVIQTNISSMESQKNLLVNQSALTKSFNRLSSGFRINSAADDAAGLGISESMKSQIRSYTVAERNANDGISMAQTAEGALGEMHNILGRMRELAMQSSNGSMTAIDRGYVQTEFAQLQAEIGRIQDSAKFNGKELVAPSASVITFQVGLDNTSTDQILVTFGGLSLSGIMTSAAVSGATTSQALAALSVIDTAISSVSTARSNFGAAMNRLEAATSNIQTMRLNISAANSRIRDVDVAEETARMSKNQVLSQAGIAILSQANQLPQLATQLIGR
jgi:flagellin